MKRIFFTLFFVVASSVFTYGQTIRAAISQNDNDAPTATVFVNTFPTAPVLTRLGPGLYRLYIADAFPDETRIFGLNRQVLDASIGTTLSFARIIWDDEAETPGSSVLIHTFDVNMQTGVSVSTDSRLNRTPIEITVYPIEKPRK